jgi:hypothetical protein
VLFAAILVFLDSVLVSVLAVILLFGGYFVVEGWLVRVSGGGREVVLFGVVGYVSVFLYVLEENPENNYFGWLYITILSVNITHTTILQLQSSLKTIKHLLTTPKNPSPLHHPLL